MRIALLSLHFAEYATRLALALAENHDVLLILREDNAQRELSPGLASRLAASPRLKTCRIQHRPLKDPRCLLNAIRIYRNVSRFRPDIVHFQEFLADYAALSAIALWRRFPGILTVHDHVTHTGADSRSSTRGNHYRHWLRNKASRLIVHGERIRSEMLASEPHRQGTIDSVFHGVLGAESAPYSMHDATPGTLLFFGRVEAYKGLGDLLTACETLHQRSIAFRLRIAGKGTDLDNHRARVVSAPWIELDETYIPVEAVPELFRRAALVVLPYTDATQSGVAALAFAFGRPVLATATGALPEVVIPGQTGELVPPRQPQYLADTLERLLTHPALLANLAAGAAKFAGDELNWHTIAGHTQRTYEQAIASTTGPVIEAGQAV